MSNGSKPVMTIGTLIARGDRLVFPVAHDSADVARSKKSLHPVERRLQNRSHGRRHENMGDQDREIVDALFLRLPDGHGVARRGRFEADGEKDNLLVGIGARDFQGIDRRINDAHVRSARFQDQQIDLRTRHAQHVAKGTENDVRPMGNRVRLVDHLQRSDTDRASRAVHQFHFFGKQAIDAIFDNGMRLTAADFHQNPWLGDHPTNFIDQFFGERFVAIFIEIFHR